MLLVAPAERFGQQRRSEPLAMEVGLNADRRQIPMRIAWMVGRHLAKHGIHIRHDVGRHALIHDSGDRIFVRLHTRRNPQRTPEIAVDPPNGPGREGLARERPDEPPKVGEVSLWIAIRPARHRVCGEGQGHNADQLLQIGRLGGSDATAVPCHAARPCCRTLGSNSTARGTKTEIGLRA
jgi:hypothetical protein